MELQALLAVPFAHGEPVCTARFKAEPEDFVVREWLGFEADGEGPHWLLTIRKRDANTQWVARELAQIARVHPRDVGYAGMKDRRAVTEQSFTIPANDAIADWSNIHGEGFEVIKAARHRRKLKIGALKGNAFEIRLRDAQGDRAAIDARLQAIGSRGVPNYFGPQRFGRDARNLSDAIEWFEEGKEPRDRQQRSFALSAARSALFNQFVAARVRAGSWNRLLAGDVANLNGSGSIFDVPILDSTLEQRCAELDIHPTAPLWGRGALRSQGDVVRLEQEIANQSSTLADGLSRAGLEQERRATRMAVANLAWQWIADDLQLTFQLGRGCFATSVLRELVRLDPADVPADES